LVMRAMDIAAAVLTPRVKATADADVFFRQQADALAHLAHVFLAGDNCRGATADNYQLMVNVDETTLHDAGGKSDLPIESVRRITCDASNINVAEDIQGNP
jgi:hypothetical protein